MVRYPAVCHKEGSQISWVKNLPLKDTYEEALADVQSAITFHIETFGSEVVEDAASVLEVFVAEAGIPL